MRLHEVLSAVWVLSCVLSALFRLSSFPLFTDRFRLSSSLSFDFSLSFRVLSFVWASHSIEVRSFVLSLFLHLLVSFIWSSLFRLRSFPFVLRPLFRLKSPLSFEVFCMLLSSVWGPLLRLLIISSVWSPLFISFEIFSLVFGASVFVRRLCFFIWHVQLGRMRWMCLRVEKYHRPSGRNAFSSETSTSCKFLKTFPWNDSFVLKCVFLFTCLLAILFFLHSDTLVRRAKTRRHHALATDCRLESTVTRPLSLCRIFPKNTAQPSAAHMPPQATVRRCLAMCICIPKNTALQIAIERAL